jgi:tripartite-type tricarboxylate transporter receptor subunit TctC
MSRKWLIFILASILTIGMVTLAYAGDFPERDIQGIIQWGAGGSTDNIARALTPHVEKHLGKQIVLVNKPGGGGAVSTQYVFNQPADGYTLLYGAYNPELFGVLGVSKLSYDEFYPLVILNRDVGIIVANAEAPWNTFKELVEDAKKKPGEIKMGSTGPGGLPFVIGAMAQSITDYKVTSVPYGGTGPGITALLGNHIDFMPISFSGAGEHLRAGRIKVLAVVADKPVKGLEKYRLITEDYPEFKMYLPWGPYWGVFCKKDVPQDVRAKLTDAFTKGADAEQFKKFISDFGAIHMNIQGDEALQYMKRWKSVTTWLLYDVGATKASPADFGIPQP